MLCIILLNESNPRMIDSQNWGQAGRTSTFIKINKLNNRCLFVCLFLFFIFDPHLYVFGKRCEYIICFPFCVPCLQVLYVVLCS